MQTIDTVHHKVHEGRFFSGGYYNAALANGATLDILIQGGSLQSTHTVFGLTSGAECTVQIFEDVTFSSAGTAITMSNHNRSSTKVVSGTFTHSPTITSTGNQINGTAYVAGGNGGNASGGTFAGFTTEFLLDKTKNYLLRVTNVSGGTIKASGHLDLYQPNL